MMSQENLNNIGPARLCPDLLAKTLLGDDAPVYNTEFSEAVEAAERATELDSDDAMVRANLGLALAASGEPQAAVRAYGKALKLMNDRSDERKWLQQQILVQRAKPGRS